MKKLILILGTLSLIAQGANALDAKDDCFDAATELSKGIARSYKVYDKKPAAILKLELTSETEIREYSLSVTHSGSVDFYTIELENDSAYKCVLNHISPTRNNE